MKKILIIFILSSFFYSQYAKAQGWLWAKGINNRENYGINVITDSFGNVYVSGIYYKSPITIDSITLTFDSTASRVLDKFLVKYDSLGNVIWAINTGGANGPATVTLDRLGNIYVADLYDSFINFGACNLNSCGNNTLFLTKYDKDGNCIWAKSSNCFYGYWSGQFLMSTALAIDTFGSIYLAGNYSGNILTFDTVTLDTGSHNGGLFLFKFDTAGNAVWARGVGGGTGLFGNQLNGMSVDKFNNIYITGFYNDTITFGNSHLGYNGQAMFLVKYNTAGAVDWAKVSAPLGVKAI